MARHFPQFLRLCLPLAFVSAACGTRQFRGSFFIVPSVPEYSLRSPDRKVTPFSEIPGGFTHIASGWVELKPGMGLRVENAYYEVGTPKRGIQNYLGTEIARYLVAPDGRMRQTSFESHVAARPSDQPPVQRLLPETQQRLRFHRFFYQVVMNRRSGVKSAIVLGSPTADRLETTTQQLLADPESVCQETNPTCTAFPEACSVSLEMQIVVNGAPRTVSWATNVGNIAPNATVIDLRRPYAGRLRPMQIQPNDPQALRLPLLPGDRITYR